MAKIGRNDPCPCGSGQKYKRCCLPRDEAAAAARARFARPVDESDLPRGLLERFEGEARAQVVAMLRFLSPLTTTSAATVCEARA